MAKPAASVTFESAPSKSQDDEGDDQIIKNINFCPKGVYVMNLCSTLSNTFVLSTSGLVYSWGAKGDILGRKVYSQLEASKPGLVAITGKTIQICAGNNHVMALDTHGNLSSWGKNEFGQLGHGILDPSGLPKDIDTFKKDPVAQIHAGADSSYAMTKKGSLYVWGDNRNYQLGVLGQLHQLPYRLTQTPWDNPKEIRIVYGRSNVAYMFEFQNVQEEIDKQKFAHLLADAQNEISKLQTKLLEFQGLNTKQPIHIEKNMGDDYILRATQQQLQLVENNQDQQRKYNQQLEADIDQIDKDLLSIKQQLFDIFTKETELNNSREQIDMIVRRLTRSGTGDPKELENKIKEQKRIKELFQANDNIKNTLLKKQNQSEELKIHQSEELIKQREKENELKNLYDLLEYVAKDRRIFLRTKFMEQNKADLEKFMDKINHFFKAMLETNISDIARKSTHVVGLEEIILQSNQKLAYIKNELSGFKVNSNDESYEILSKILDILQDNLGVRKRLNDYLSGLVMSVVDKTQVPVEQKAVNDKQEKKLQEFIKKQQKEIQAIGKEYIDMNAQKQQQMCQNGPQQKARSNCFGF